MSKSNFDPKLLITLNPNNTFDEPLYIYRDDECGVYYFHLSDSSAVVSPKAFNEFVDKLRKLRKKNK